MNNENGHWLNSARHTRSPNEKTTEPSSGTMLWHIPRLQITKQWVWPLKQSSGTAQRDNNILTLLLMRLLVLQGTCMHVPMWQTPSVSWKLFTWHRIYMHYILHVILVKVASTTIVSKLLFVYIYISVCNDNAY